MGFAVESVPALTVFFQGLLSFFSPCVLPLVPLYVSYLATYLLNDWLEWGPVPILVFTGIFLLGYVAVWVVIYATTKRKTDRLNEIFREKQNGMKHR